MAGDIEAFLRMAAERRRQAQGGGQGAANPPVPTAPVTPPSPPRPAQRAPLSPSLRPSDSAPSGMGQRRATEPAIDPYAQANDLPQRPKQAKPKTKERGGARPVAPADKPRLKPSVEPSIHRPQPAALEPYDAKPTPAAAGETLSTHQILQMLQSPNSIASAIILSEILKPVDFD